MVDRSPLEKTNNGDGNSKLYSILLLANKLPTLGDKDLKELWNPINWDHKEFICGWASAFINICVTYPINKVIFRQVGYQCVKLKHVVT